MSAFSLQFTLDPSDVARERLGLPEHPDTTAFADALGRSFEVGDCYYDTTTGRVRTWAGGAFVDLAELPAHLLS